jgi:hypothetical protein
VGETVRETQWETHHREGCARRHTCPRRVDGRQTLDVRVRVQAAVAQHDQVPEEIGSLHRLGQGDVRCEVVCRATHATVKPGLMGSKLCAYKNPRHSTRHISSHRTWVLVCNEVVTAGIIIEKQLIVGVVIAPAGSPLELLIREGREAPGLVDESWDASQDVVAEGCVYQSSQGGGVLSQ